MNSSRRLFCFLVAIRNITVAISVSSNSCQLTTSTAPFTSLSSSSFSKNHSFYCPLWAYCDNHAGICKCLEKNHVFQCGSLGKKNYILRCFCITYKELSKKLEVGLCFYNCDYIGKTKHGIDIKYSLLPYDVSDFNKACSVYNRTGTLCGKCKNNTYLPAYSYHISCKSCGNWMFSVLKYVFVVYVPLTLFCVLIIAMGINVPSSQLQGYVFFCQIITCPVFTRSALFYLGEGPKQNPYKIGYQVFGTIYGIWNLDFFRLFDLNICFQRSTLLILSLDFFVALYPLLLIMLIYLAFKISPNSYLHFVITRPFKLLFRPFKTSRNVKTSTINAFATFVFLSNTKFLSISFDLLIPVQVCDPSSNGECVLAVFNDATISYFGRSHIPYAILALLVFIIFTLLPILVLLLYPLSFCQKCLTILPPRWRISLHVFLDSFQGCYKDGTEHGDKDCRWFSAVPFIVRLSIFFIYCIFDLSSFLRYCIMLLVVTAILVIIVDPHKPQFKHHSDHLVVFVICLACTMVCVDVLPGGVSIVNYLYAILGFICLYQFFYILVLLQKHFKHGCK